MTGQLLSTEGRAFAGALVTIVNLEDGATEVVHAKGYYFQTGSNRARVLRQTAWSPRAWRDARNYGPPSEAQVPGTARIQKHGVLDALRALCEALEAREGDWRVRTISTPQLIFQDMQGRQPSRPGGEIAHPEPAMLTKVGYPHLYERSGR
jgi:hypothetical protein